MNKMIPKRLEIEYISSLRLLTKYKSQQLLVFNKKNLWYHISCRGCSLSEFANIEAPRPFILSICREYML